MAVTMPRGRTRRVIIEDETPRRHPIRRAREVAEEQRLIKLGVRKGVLSTFKVRMSRKQLEHAYEIMHEALEKILEGGPHSCVNLAEEALEDVFEIMEERHG